MVRVAEPFGRNHYALSLHTRNALTGDMTQPINDDARLVARYIRYSESLDRVRGGPRASDADKAAYNSIHETIRNGPPSRAWGLVLDILRAVPDEKLGLYAVGPLENLVARWGDVLVEEIESEAARDTRFRWALGTIWLTELGFSRTASERQALARIVAASGGHIKVAEWLPKPTSDT